MTVLRRTMIAALLAVSLASCGARRDEVTGPEGAELPPPDPAVRVFAAASLADVMEELAVEWMRQGGTGPVVNLAASSALARQIEQGARADIFISADQQWMDYLAEQGLIDPATRTDLLGNLLVLVTPADRPFDLRLEKGASLASLIGRTPGGGRLALADPDAVPAGRYAKEALTALELWPEVEAMVVPAEDARAALRLVTSGEADAGVVYRTDARAAGPALHVAGEFPAESHVPIVYPMALTADAARGPASRFQDFLTSPEASEIFDAHGFIAPAAP